MARKHNTKHDRSRSHYPERLAARGLGKTPVMHPFVTPAEQESLRRKTTRTLEARDA